MPSRGIIGLRTNVLTAASAGEAIMAHRFLERIPAYKGEIERRTNGFYHIAMESGTTLSLMPSTSWDRGKFFIFPQEEAYARTGCRR